MEFKSGRVDPESTTNNIDRTALANQNTVVVQIVPRSVIDIVTRGMGIAVETV